MTNGEIVAQVIENVRGDREAIQKIAAAIVSRDQAQVARVLTEVGQVEVDSDLAAQLVKDRALVAAAAYPT